MRYLILIFCLGFIGCSSIEHVKEDNLEDVNDNEQIKILNPKKQYKASKDYKHSREERASFLKKSAQQGHIPAQWDLAEQYYYSGFAKDEDLKKAFYWYLKLARNGYKKSYFQLAEIYKDGKGVPVNLKKSAFWLKKSAISGDRIAQSMLMKAYLVKKNYLKYFYWLEKLEGKESALKKKFQLARNYHKGINSLTRNYKKAIFWYAHLANKNYLPAQNELGEIYREGVLLKKSLRRSFKLFKQAAYKNYSLAQYNLALAYYKGLGVRKNYIKAYKWLALYQSNGSAYSLYSYNEITLNSLESKMKKNQIKKAQDLANQFKNARRIPSSKN